MRRNPLCLFVLSLALCTTFASAQVKISQVYGGGGNTFAPVSNDYIEIYNAGAPQLLTGWSVQYASSTGTTWTVTSLPAITLLTGQYLLIQEAAGVLVSPQAVSLPAFDASGTIAMSATDFKVALVNSTTALVGGIPTYAANPTLVDFVGGGTAANWNDNAAAGAAFLAANNAPPPSATLAIFRHLCGAQDTNSSKDDWSYGAPMPRNTATALNAGLSLGGTVFPYIARQGETVSFRCTPRLCATNLLNPGTVVTADLTAFGLGSVPMHDDGLAGDDLAGDGLYMLDVTVPGGQAAASYQVPITANDGGNSGGAYLGLAVVASASTPANDNCNGSTPIPGPYGAGVSVMGDMTGANVESNPLVTSITSSTSGFSSRRGLWYTVTGTGNTMTASTCATSPALDAVLYVLCGTCDGFSEVTSNDDAGTTLCPASSAAAVCSWCSIAGQTYYINVSPFSSGASTAPITVTISDNGTPCTGAMPCTTCVLAAPVAQSEVEPGFGPSTNDGCPVTPNTFTTIGAPSFPATVLNGTARAMGGNRDIDAYRFQATASDLFYATVTGQASGYQIQFNSLSAGGVCPQTSITNSALSGRCASTSLTSVVTAGTWYSVQVIATGIEGAPAGAVFGGQIPSAGTYNYALSLAVGGQPPNDNCASAATLALSTTYSNGSTQGATNDGSATCDASGRDVWYAVTLSTGGTLRVDTCGSGIDTAIAVYSACGGAELGCNDDCPGGTCVGPASCLSVPCLAPGSYRIRVSDKNIGVGGLFVVRAQLIANDCCATASTLALSATYTAGTTVGYTNDGTSACDATGRDAWYSVTTGATGTLNIDSCTSAIDTAIAVYSTCGGAEIACSDDCGGAPCGPTSSCLSLVSLPAGTYRVRVSDKGLGNGGTFNVRAQFVVDNDTCATAIVVACGGSVAGTTSGATAEVGLPAGCIGPQAPGRSQSYTYTNSVWYKVTPAASGTVTADTVSSTPNYDSKMFVWTGTCAGLTCVTANDDINVSFESKVAWVANAGQDYYIMIGPFGSTAGNFILSVSCNPTPANDSCTTPQLLSPAESGSVFGTTVGSTSFLHTSTSAFPGCAGTSPADGGVFDVWYQYTACATGNLMLSACGGFDTLLSVHTACPTATVSNQLAPTASSCNNNGALCSPGSDLTVAVTSGTTYLIRVAGAVGANPEGTFTLAWSATGLPTWFQDFDGDGFGNSAVTVQACGAPPGYVGNGLDCNDTNAAIKPGAVEVCDGIDNDCDNLTDDADPGIVGQPTWFQDFDGDGFGNPGVTQLACLQPTGYVANSADCDDGNNAINPAATEICDGIDNDCDGMTDDADPGVVGQLTWYQDLDADTFGNTAVSQLACAQPSGYVSVGGDCNDNVAAINPNATEICDGVDNDCDGLTDEVCPSNDSCITAMAISDGSISGDNSIAGSEIIDLSCGAVSNDVWFLYTNTGTCTYGVTASMCIGDGGGATFDAVIHVFSGSCGALSLIACNNSACGLDPKVTFGLGGGSSVYIAVSAVAPGPGGLFKMVVSHGSASMSQLGPGCTDGGGPGPTLTLNLPPVLGALRTVSITGAVPASPGMLLFSDPANGPSPLPGGCNLWLDQGTMVFFLFFGTDAAGNWSVTETVPGDPAAECLLMTVQGVIFPAGGVPFYQVTSGLGLVLGY